MKNFPLPKKDATKVCHSQLSPFVCPGVRLALNPSQVCVRILCAAVYICVCESWHPPFSPRRRPT